MIFSRNIFKEEKAPSFALLVTTLNKYGNAALTWEPELLKHQIESDYDIKVSDLQADKLQAAITVMTTNQFETDWRVFEVVSNLFNNSATDHMEIDPLEAEEIAVALAEVALIKQGASDDDEKIDYSDEVRAYAGKVFYEYGMHKAPKIFLNAIMPESAPANDDDKNEALKELFNARVEFILDYLEKNN